MSSELKSLEMVLLIPRLVISIAISDIGNRPAYLYRFWRDIPILALNPDFPVSCGGVPILEDAGIFRADFVLFCFRRYFRILLAFCTYLQSRRCVAAINSPPYVMNQCYPSMSPYKKFPGHLGDWRLVKRRKQRKRRPTVPFPQCRSYCLYRAGLLAIQDQ